MLSIYTFFKFTGNRRITDLFYNILGVLFYKKSVFFFTMWLCTMLCLFGSFVLPFILYLFGSFVLFIFYRLCFSAYNILR